MTSPRFGEERELQNWSKFGVRREVQSYPHYGEKKGSNITGLI